MRAFLLLILSLHLSCSSQGPRKIPAKDPNVMKFCVVGDVGNGSSAQLDVAEAMEESGCEELILLGDLIYPSGIKSAQDTILFNRFITPYQNFKKIYLVLGNHDYRGNPQAWQELARNDQRIIHPAPFFREKINESCLFFLDTNFNNDKSLYEKQSDWMKENSEGCSYKVAFSHHPYLSSGKRHGPAKDKLKSFYDEFVIGKFQLIFSGHEHYLRDEGVVQGTRQIISGAGGKYDKGESYGFTIYKLNLKNPEKSSYEIIRL